MAGSRVSCHIVSSLSLVAPCFCLDLFCRLGCIHRGCPHQGHDFCIPYLPWLSIQTSLELASAEPCFLRRWWHPTPVLLPGKSHWRRSLVGYSPWGCEESDTTERLHFHFSLSCIGEGHGNPLQCSCLENPRDGEAWWAAIYGVAQSQTPLKWLSSSSSRDGKSSR